ncbi:MAG: GTP-binding protein [Hyphomicrobiales bacterium]|nr:GTP-binding protein [Hyphomicrobiales bacterium]MBV9906057.1 GTP-binding protein [Hyphomicrobiales bacterium]
MSSDSARTETKTRIPVTLVTGFLGSGKTTFINAALRSPELAKTVVVVNEFGEVGLDHQLFASSSDSVVVLENGCLCCTVRSDLVGTLNSLYYARQASEIPSFDNVVIETSGLAEPGAVLQAFLSEPTLDGLYRIAGVVTLVDAVNWRGTAETHDEAVRQVALADQIRITKLDLADDRRSVASRLLLELRRTNPSAEIAEIDWTSAAVARLLTISGFDTSDPLADPRPWLALQTYQKAADDHHDHRHHDHDRHEHDHRHPAHLEGRGIENFVLMRDSPLTREEVQFLLEGIGQNLGAGLLRVKGLVNIAEEPGRPAVIQGAQHLLHTMTWLDRWPDADQRTRIVFITQGIQRESLKDIIDLLDRVSSRTFKARAKGRQAQEAAKATAQTQ